MAKSKPKREEKLYLQCASIQPNAVHMYYRPVNGFEYGARHIANRANLEDNESEGVMSAKARKRLETAVMMLLYKAKPKRVTDTITGKQFSFLINFITLTLPASQAHSDNEIKSVCVNNFLAVMRKEFNLNNYVWRAEAQLNGNIHFHFVTDTYIHYKDLRRVWNQSVELLGYVSKFEEKFHHRNPPTEEVRSVKHIKRIANYLSKYMAKSRSFVKIGEVREYKGEQFEILFGSQEYRNEKANCKKGKVIASIISGPVRRIEGRLWFLSRSLSKCKPIQISQDMYEFSAVEELLSVTDFKSYQGEFVCSYYGKFASTASRKSLSIEKVFESAWRGKELKEPCTVMVSE